ncbi:hypothetical protein [Mesorhizobium amorphae]|uniref:hypothetical protein n=1 Tax=Mesorhizobium amorphae TaxID=71433 RepID=UPI0021B46817|nr:hypothetical protein [Mesorhizobium amorphae]
MIVTMWSENTLPKPGFAISAARASGEVGEACGISSMRGFVVVWAVIWRTFLKPSDGSGKYRLLRGT